MDKALYKLFYEIEDTHWWFVATRTYAISLFTKYCRTDQLKILDAGCGTGGTMQVLKNYGEVHGIDIEQEAIGYCRKRGLQNVQRGSVTAMPYKHSTFDVVMALDVIEHIEDDIQALSEIARVLVPSGILIALVPAFQWLWSSHDTLNHHYHRYTKDEIIRRMEQAGFMVLQAHYFGFSTFLPLFVKSLLERINFASPRFNVAKPLPSIVNKILLKIYQADLVVSERFPLPCGTSILIVARKTIPVSHLRRGRNWTSRNTAP